MSSNVLRDVVTSRTFKDLLEPVADEGRASGRRSGTVARTAATVREEARVAGYSDGFTAGSKEGYRVGHENGTREALAEVERQTREATDAFVAALQEFVDGTQFAVKRWGEEAEKALAGLAIEIARRALAQELQMSQESVVTIAREAMAEVTHGMRVRVRVNPFGAAALEARREELLAALTNVRDLEVVQDTTIQGGCVVESDGGVVDARVEAYLARLAKSLEEAA